MTRHELRTEDGRIVLRDWSDGDLTQMVVLFDDPEVAFRLPLPSPFDLAAARAHLEMTRRAQARGERRYFAITSGADAPLGEVMINLVDHTIGYVVGAAHRRRGLAAGAVRLITGYAHDTLSIPRVYLEIEADNTGSVAVAEAVGFRPMDVAPATVTDKGRRYRLHRWVHGPDHRWAPGPVTAGP